MSPFEEYRGGISLDEKVPIKERCDCRVGEGSGF
jgi:hypothetical protein